MKYKTNINSILITTLVTALMSMSTNTALAQYGGGGPEVPEYKSLQVIKEVKLEGDSNFRDKIYIDLTDDNEKDKNIVFRITVKNRGENVDNLKYEDFLPSALNKESGDLTEEISSLNYDETRYFEIKTSLKEDEINLNTEFEKCIVNKVDLRHDGDFEDSDVATVCYGNVAEPTNLPETGFVPFTGIAGISLVTISQYLKRRIKK